MSAGSATKRVVALPLADRFREMFHGQIVLMR